MLPSILLTPWRMQSLPTYVSCVLIIGSSLSFGPIFHVLVWVGFYASQETMRHPIRQCRSTVRVKDSILWQRNHQPSSVQCVLVVGRVAEMRYGCILISARFLIMGWTSVGTCSLVSILSGSRTATLQSLCYLMMAQTQQSYTCKCIWCVGMLT